MSQTSPDLIFRSGLSLKEYTSTLAAIVSEVASTKGVSEETARTCLLAAYDLLKPKDDADNRPKVLVHILQNNP